MEKILALAAALASSPLPVQKQATFRSGVELRTLSAAVTDSRGRPVSGLAQADFALQENGSPRPIAYFLTEKERLPLDVALLVDTSASMDDKGRLGHARRAALAFIAALKAEDRVQIVDFDSRVESGTALTADRAVLAAAVGGLEAGGSTALYNAVFIALRQMKDAAAPGRQQAVVILSDGEDTSSLMSYGEVLDAARGASATVHAIAPEEITGESRATLVQVASETGGRAIFTKNFKELPAVYAALAQELSSRYVIGFYPADPALESRVHLTLPGRRDLSARTRRSVR